MKTRKIPWKAIASGLAATCVVLAGCRSTSAPPESMVPDEPIYLGPEDFDSVIAEPTLIGQERIDYLRAEMHEDLEMTLAVDPDHPGVEQIRRALADLDREEREFHWRVSKGFTRPDGVWNTTYTEEEFWRAIIEDWEILELTEEQVRAAEAHLESILAAKDSLLADTTVAASGGGNTVVCTVDAALDWRSRGSMSYSESEDLLHFRTGVDQVTTSHMAGYGVVRTPQRHRFTGLAEPDARSSSGNLTTYIPTIWKQRDCVSELNSPQTFVYTGAQPGAEYCAGGPFIGGPFARAEKWSQVNTWDYTNWTNYDSREVIVEEDCVTVPGGGGGGGDDPPPPGERECTWISGPGYGYWLCVTG